MTTSPTKPNGHASDPIAAVGLPAGGWFRVPNTIVDRAAELGAAAVLVYLVLARHADKNGLAFPSLKRIGKLCKAGKSSVLRALGVLSGTGWIRIERGCQEHGGREVNRYYLTPQGPGITTGPGHPLGGSTTGPPLVSPQDQGGTTTGPKQDSSNKTQSNKREKRAPADAGPPAALLELIDGWNALGEGIVKRGYGARRDRPASAALKGWRRAMGDAEQKDAFQDIPALLAAIERATFCHEKPWFTLPWLFGRNKHGECNVVRLLTGAYDEDESKLTIQWPKGFGEPEGVP